MMLTSSTIFSQENLNYLEHKTFTTNENSFNESLYAVRNPYTDQLISRFKFSVRFPITIDLSLGSSSEPFNFEPPEIGTPEHYAIFKLHNGNDLAEEFNFVLATSNIQAGAPGFQFSPDYFAVEYRIDPSKTLRAGPDQIIENTSELNYLTCLLGYDSDGTLLNQRLISHKLNLLSRTIPIHDEKFFGIMDDQLQCMDFTFRDTIVIVEDGETTEMHSDDWTTYLDVRYADGMGYSGIIENSGTLFRRDAVAIGSKVYRAFEISGTADLDPTASVSNYTTPGDEHHLVLACYDILGNVEWTKLIARFQTEMTNPGRFACTLLNDQDKLILEYHYTGNENSGASSGSFYALNDAVTLESGDLIVSDDNRRTPTYVHLMNSDNGQALQVYSMNAEDATTSGFAQNYLSRIDVRPFEPGQIIMHFKSLLFGTINFVIRSLYPEEMIYEDELEPTTAIYTDLYVFPTVSSTLADHFIFGFEQESGGSTLVTNSFAPLNNEDIIICGNINKTVHMIFPNVPPVTVSAFPDPTFGSDAVAIFVEKSILQTTNREDQLFELFPNPASASITIASNMNQTRFWIFDRMGKNVQSGVLQNNSESVDISSLASGLYLIQIESEGGRTGTRKFVKH